MGDVDKRYRGGSLKGGGKQQEDPVAFTVRTEDPVEVTVFTLKSRGASNDDIAKFVDIPVDELFEKYGDILERSIIYANHTVSEALFKMATGTSEFSPRPNLGAMKLWLQTYKPKLSSVPDPTEGSRSIFLIPEDSAPDEWLIMESDDKI